MSRLVYGIGVYDQGRFRSRIDGVATKEYNLWCSMLGRCIPNGKWQSRYPSYIGCEVHNDFLNFQKFSEWCHEQIGFGVPNFHLDKDILSGPSKVYSPSTCCFIPHTINLLLNHQHDIRSPYPIGVVYEASRKKFKSQVSINGKMVNLGRFDTADDAHTKYCIAKLKEIHRQAELYRNDIDILVYDALMKYEIN